jgi:Mg/Co/Ni transporter MgtE
MDKYSDIDIMVFLRKENNVTRKQIRQISSEEQQLAGADMDVEVHTIEAYRKKK